MHDVPFVFVDVETTGSSPNYNRILEIAVIRVEQGKIVETLNTVVDPECPIPNSITSLTGISETDIKHAPTFNDISHDIEAFIEGAIFVAHNAQFDYAFLKSEFKRLNKRFQAKRLCTVALSRTLFPNYKRHDLSSIIDRFDFECKNRHRAYDDAKVLIDFLNICKQHFSQTEFDETLHTLIYKRANRTHVPMETLENLPETSGVYVFYGEDGEKLYIGKSINIKKRVLSHFRPDGTSKSLKLSQEVRDIEAIPTHGELGALLLESRMVKQDQPLYNRMLRHARKLISAEEVVDDRGYKNVEFRELLFPLSQYENLTDKTLGIFKSLRQAKKTLEQYAESYKLCPALLGLEKSRSGCFASQIGKCNGACKGKESSDLYNIRFDQAFDERRIKTWPYSGPIMIEEKGSEKYTGTVFVVDNWCLVKSFTYDEENNEHNFLQSSSFDYDSYKILSHFIVKNPKRIRYL